jgi:TRAP-type uncharacterized transport system substrate-binding protein
VKPLAWTRPHVSRRLWRWVVGFSIALTLLVYLIVRYVSPMPPHALVMSTGVEDGAYHHFGLRYQAILRASGVRLELRPSSGAIENVERLRAGQVSVAFVQGGLGPLSIDPEATPESSPLRALATVAFEPVWIFTHTLDVSQGLNALAGKRIEVGVPHSGNQKVASELLQVYGVNTGGAPDGTGPAPDGTTTFNDGGSAAAEKLLRHEVDAVIVIAAPQASAVRTLLTSPSIKLASLDHVEGLARRLPYLQPVSLKRGSVDPAHDLPPHDIALLATNANLVVSEGLHPALAYLLLQAARQVHHPAGLLNLSGEFPTPNGTDFPLSSEAERYFRNGPPFLQSYLPFWVANYVQRLLLLLVPLAAILLPMARLLPDMITWRRRSRLYRRYGELRFLEQDVESRALNEDERREANARLDRIEDDILHTRFPLDFSDRVYTLRQHVEFVREQIARSGAPR